MQRCQHFLRGTAQQLEGVGFAGVGKLERNFSIDDLGLDLAVHFYTGAIAKRDRGV